MRIRFTLLAAAITCTLRCITPATAADALPTGTPLMPLAQLARQVDATLSAAENNGYATFSTPHRQLIFVPSVRRITVNGLSVHMNGPYVLNDGTGFVSKTDVATVLRPLLNEPTNAPPLPARPRVMLDPGHGGEDSGALGLGATQEKSLVLEISHLVKAALEDSGIDVRLTRENDIFLALDERADLANRWGANLFVSIHLNSSRNRNAAGVETYVLAAAGFPSTAEGSRSTGSYPGNQFDEENMRLAYYIHKGLVFQTRADDRGVRRARFEVLRETRCPAVLTECGFLSNPDESWLLRKPDYCSRVAQGLASGILTYIGRRERATRPLLPVGDPVPPVEDFAEVTPPPPVKRPADVKPVEKKPEPAPAIVANGKPPEPRMPQPHPTAKYAPSPPSPVEEPVPGTQSAENVPLTQSEPTPEPNRLTPSVVKPIG